MLYTSTKKYEYKGQETNEYTEKEYMDSGKCVARTEHKILKKEDGTEVKITKEYENQDCYSDDNTFGLYRTVISETDMEGNKLIKTKSNNFNSEIIKDKNNIVVMDTYQHTLFDAEPVNMACNKEYESIQIQEMKKETTEYKDKYSSTKIINYNLDPEEELKVCLVKETARKKNDKDYIETTAKIQFKCENGNTANYDIEEGYITSTIKNSDGNVIAKIDFEPTYTNYIDYDKNGNIINRQNFCKGALSTAIRTTNYYDEQNRLIESVSEQSFDKMPPASWYQDINPYENLWEKYRGKLL